MKKILLSFFALAGLFGNSFAQCAAGFSATGISDDFSSTSEVSTVDGGIYYYAAVGTASCAAFSATMSRSTNPGMLSVVQNGPYGCYIPFGYSFGYTPTGATVTLDLTSDKTFTVDITNPASDTSSLVFRIGILDSLDRMIDTYATAGTTGGGNCDNAWQYVIATTLAPGETKTLSGTFAGGYQADYTMSPPQAMGTTGSGCWLKNNLDFTIVSKVFFTVVNTKQNPADGFKPYAVGNGTDPLVIIDNLRVGACPTASVNNAAANIASTKLFPNPVSDMANVELNMKSASNVKVTLTDMMGRPVMTIAEGNMTELNKSFSVANLNKGVYTVNYFVNGTAAKSEMLMVK